MVCATVTVVVLSLSAGAQHTGPVQGNAGQASQPGGVSSGPGNPASTPNAGSLGSSDSQVAPTGSSRKKTPPAETRSQPASGSDAANTASQPSAKTTSPAASSTDDNPYDPLLEPPPMPKGKPTLIGGTASRIDHVRNRLTIEPFGGGAKVKMFLDERSHIYRNGAETTVLGIHKGDRVYADTMLDGTRIFAKNVRVINDVGSAEVRGQVTGSNPSKGTITMRDELSSQPVTFAVNNRTKFSAVKGSASAGDIQPGSLIDVQFAPDRSNRDIAQEIIVLAKPGDSYIFSGVVTHLDMRTGTLALDNRSDEQTYEVHFDPPAVENRDNLKVGSEITAHATFDGKEYKAANVRVEKGSGEEQPDKQQ